MEMCLFAALVGATAHPLLLVPAAGSASNLRVCATALPAVTSRLSCLIWRLQPCGNAQRLRVLGSRDAHAKSRSSDPEFGYVKADASSVPWLRLRAWRKQCLQKLQQQIPDRLRAAAVELTKVSSKIQPPRQSGSFGAGLDLKR